MPEVARILTSNTVIPQRLLVNPSSVANVPLLDPKLKRPNKKSDVNEKASSTPIHVTRSKTRSPSVAEKHKESEAVESSSNKRQTPKTVSDLVEMYRTKTHKETTKITPSEKPNSSPIKKANAFLFQALTEPEAPSSTPTASPSASLIPSNTNSSVENSDSLSTTRSGRHASKSTSQSNEDKTERPTTTKSNIISPTTTNNLKSGGHKANQKPNKKLPSQPKCHMTRRAAKQLSTNHIPSQTANQDSASQPTSTQTTNQDASQSSSQPESPKQSGGVSLLRRAMQEALLTSSPKSLNIDKVPVSDFTPISYGLSILDNPTEVPTPPPPEKNTDLYNKTSRIKEVNTELKSIFPQFLQKEDKPKRKYKRAHLQVVLKKRTKETPKQTLQKDIKSSNRYSLRTCRKKRKHFGDDYLSDEIKEEIEDDNDDDFVDTADDDDNDTDTEESNEVFKKVNSKRTSKMSKKKMKEEPIEDLESTQDNEDSENFPYYDEENLEAFFQEEKYTTYTNRRGNFNCKKCDIGFKWSMTFLQHIVDKHKHLMANMKIHSCTLCEKSFLASRDLASHYRKVHKKLDCFICKICNATFHAALSYNKHRAECEKKTTDDLKQEAQPDDEFEFTLLNDQEKRFICNVCLRPLRTQEGLEKHQKMHEDDGYLCCELCGVKCTTKQRLNRHKHAKHQINEGHMKCPNCDRTFLTMWTLYRHNCEVHGSKQVICRQCGLFVDTQEELSQHIIKVHPDISEDVMRFSCEDCGKWFDQCRYLYVHYKEVHKKKRSICRFCGKTCVTKEEFSKHMKTHDLSIPNTCKLCAVKFDSPENLEKHMQSHIKGRKIFTCEVCDEVFIRKIELVDHMVVHTKIYPFVCKECGKGFKNKGKLKVHMIVHVSDRPFQCETCGMTFKMKTTLQNHVSRHKGSVFHKCDYCNLKFKSVEGVRNHMLIYHIKPEDLKNVKFKVYKCEYCQKLMGQKHVYMRHVRLHTGERPCACDICGRQFTMPSTLNVHKKTHLQKKPYHCDTCDYGFIDQNKYTKHIQTARHKFMEKAKNRSQGIDDEAEESGNQSNENSQSSLHDSPENGQDMQITESIKTRLSNALKNKINNQSKMSAEEDTPQIKTNRDMTIYAIPDMECDSIIPKEEELSNDKVVLMDSIQKNEDSLLLQDHTDLLSQNSSYLISLQDEATPEMIAQVLQSSNLQDDFIITANDIDENSLLD